MPMEPPGATGTPPDAAATTCFSVLVDCQPNQPFKSSSMAYSSTLAAASSCFLVDVKSTWRKRAKDPLPYHTFAFLVPTARAYARTPIGRKKAFSSPLAASVFLPLRTSPSPGCTERRVRYSASTQKPGPQRSEHVHSNLSVLKLLEPELPQHQYFGLVELRPKS